jgi:hypothetical protein
MAGSMQHHSDLLSTLLLGWYAVQTGITGTKLQTDYRPTVFVAWAISPALALVVQDAAPHYSTALCSMVIGGIGYRAVSAVTRPAAQTT